ncbi:MAG: DUF4440 domain-containing protein [Vicinamibacteria bacterium]
MVRWAIAVVLVAWGLPAAAQDAASEAARANLLQVDTEWAVQAGSGKDVERIVSFWTDDATIYPPHEAPIVGKAAIRAYVSESLKIPGFSISWKPMQAVVSASGDLGFTTGTNSFTFPDSQGQLSTARGRYVAVWRRARGGTWQCVVDFWNEAPAGSGAEPK